MSAAGTEPPPKRRLPFAPRGPHSDWGPAADPLILTTSSELGRGPGRGPGKLEHAPPGTPPWGPGSGAAEPGDAAQRPASGNWRCSEASAGGKKGGRAVKGRRSVRRLQRERWKPGHVWCEAFAHFVPFEPPCAPSRIADVAAEAQRGSGWAARGPPSSPPPPTAQASEGPRSQVTGWGRALARRAPVPAAEPAAGLGLQALWPGFQLGWATAALGTQDQWGTEKQQADSWSGGAQFSGTLPGDEVVTASGARLGTAHGDGPGGLLASTAHTNAQSVAQGPRLGDPHSALACPELPWVPPHPRCLLTNILPLSSGRSSMSTLSN